MTQRETTPLIEPLDTHGVPAWRGRFTAMANPCELLIETPDESLARELTLLAAQEAHRIETKFSRYRDDSIIHSINTSVGRPVHVDAETAQLLDYGQMLWRLSEGAFDLTSGVLRQIWKFVPGATPPSQAQIDIMLKRVGWQHVNWQPPLLILPTGMELDFGGIGKEYAVDRVAALVQQSVPLLINFGGDLRAIGAMPAAGAWRVGIQSIVATDEAEQVVSLRTGAMATSGDTYRAIEHAGRRYGHILDARSGWPAADAPRSITVLADTCTQAGSFTTLAMLQGSNAEAFLENESVRYWCLR